MKYVKVLAALGAVFILTSPASATITADFGWENGATVMGYYGTNVFFDNVMGPQTGLNANVPYDCPGPNSGTHYLKMEENPHSGTPQGYVGFIEGLTDGDVITATLYFYDITDGASPSGRLWGHYGVSGDVNSYSGSPGTGSDYSLGTGWNQVSASWTFDSALNTRDAWILEARIYSSPSTDATVASDIFIDDLHVEVSNDNATITFAPEPASLALLALGGLVLLRRR